MCNYTSSYLGSSGNKPQLKSAELVAILLEEERRRKGRNGEAGGVSLQAKARNGKLGSNPKNKDKECYNCHAKGHVKADCWAKGGGREGQGPKTRKGPNRAGRSNQAADKINDDLNDVSYMAYSNTHEISRYDWILDSGSTSHICTIREAFTEYHPLKNSTIQGVGGDHVMAHGRGTVLVNFSINGKTVRHQLRDVLHVPEAPNCLLLISRLDENGGHVEFKDAKCILKDKKNNVIGLGRRTSRLYLLEA